MLRRENLVSMLLVVLALMSQTVLTLSHIALVVTFLAFFSVTLSVASIPLCLAHTRMYYEW